ncbi:YceI family protein [Algoriphagus aestuarii]|nr:YceI family protein [Algoriphagus aestuarii]
MTKLALFLFGILMLSCVDKSDSKTLELSPESISEGILDTLNIDLLASKIFWKGTKMMGLGKHEGEIAFQTGYLVQENSQLIGGEFLVDMNSMTVTDIPATDPIPIRNLTNHLKSADFFNVDKYPFSTFRIVEIKKVENGDLRIIGDLEIKGITNRISFKAEEFENRFKAAVEIDRFDWDIAYSGSWVDRTLVDREIELRIELALY